MGIPVLALDNKRDAIGLASKYCYGLTCPDPAEDEAGFISLLVELGKRLKTKGVLFPTNDIWLMAVSKYRAVLELYYVFPMSGWATIESCVDKAKMYRLATEHGITSPATRYCSSIEDLRKKCPGFGYPVLIKAQIPPQFDRLMQKRVIHAQSAQFVLDWLARISASVSGQQLGFIIQEIVPGDATNLYTFSSYSNQRGKVVAFSVIRKLTQVPADFGTITSGLVERQDKVIELGTHLIEKIGFYGLANTEFKWDARDNTFKLMEINARSGMSIYYTTRSGVNLPYLAYQEAIGKAEELSRTLEGRYGAVWFIPKLWHPSLKRRKRPHSATESLSVTYARHPQTINSVYTTADPAPYFAFIRSYLRELMEEIVAPIRRLRKSPSRG
jgi:predicted ATP-grasp superfamily ATP-dependent carboligase